MWLISDNYTPNSRIWSYGAGHPIVPPLGQRTLPRRRPAWCLIDPRTPRPRFWTRIGPCEGSKQPKIGMEYKFSIFMRIHINTYDVFKRCKSNIYIYTLRRLMITWYHMWYVVLSLSTEVNHQIYDNLWPSEKENMMFSSVFLPFEVSDNPRFTANNCHFF